MLLFKGCKKVYMLGIGGSSMQALALVLNSCGYKVSGYDKCYGDYFEILTNKGINIDIEPNYDNIKKADLVVYSLAFSEDNPLILYCKSLGKKLISRKGLLSILDSKFEEEVAVSGTHGKSTTTYLISSILNNANFDATFHIGASSKDFLGGGLYKGEKYLVSEACEYKDSFLSFKPTVAVILNIEPDHPDYFSSYNQLLSSFLTFSSNIRDNGLLITNIELYSTFRQYLNSINRYDVDIITVGSGGDYDFNNVKVKDKTYFDLLYKGEYLDTFATTLNGYYNIYNNIISIIVALHYQIDIDIIKNTLANIGGLDRRYQKIGFVNGAEIILDYAHHPSEIKAVIESSKNTNGRLVVVFQPHTYSRTASLFKEFSTCFSGADEVIITKTFKSRENGGGKNAFSLYLEVSKYQFANYYDEFLPIAKHLKSTLRFNDKLLILGAGDIVNLANMLKHI